MAERRRPQRRSARSSTSSHQSDPLRLSNPNIFSDEFALEALNVSGSSSASSAHDNSESNRGYFNPASTSHDELNPSISDKNIQLQSSDSISQTSGPHDHSISLSTVTQEESPFADPIPQRNVSVRTTSTVSHGPQSSISSASSFVPPRVASPYRGPIGPSHPYSMYPQGVTRSSTISSHSTVRHSERVFVAGGGPEHPYSMYPQNTVPEMEEDSAMSFMHIPVGFPGRAQQYHRQIGPEGEDLADIIGPDGHTEQLPPYTRYPDGFAPKNGIRGAASILSEERAVNDPTDEVEPSEAHTRARAAVVSGAPTYRSNSHHSTDDTSGSCKEKWAEKGKKRVCRECMPLWVLALVLFLFLIGTIIGGIIGGVTASKKSAKDQGEPSAASDNSPSTVFVTATVNDATPLPTPYGLPALPTGSYNIPLNSLELSSNSCLDNANGFAWACEDSGSMIMTLEETPGMGNSVNFQTEQWYNGSLLYGPQPPILDPQGYTLSMMLDKDSKSLGPALFFWDTYDKIVVLPEDCFGQSSGKRSLSGSEIFERDMTGEKAQPGDKPWFCVWNSTIIEFFIYVTQNTTEAQEVATASTSARLITSYPTSSSTSTPTTSTSSSYTGTSIVGYGGGPTGAAASPPSSPSDMGLEVAHDHLPGHQHSSPGFPSQPQDHHRRGIDWNNPLYPRVMKIEEKRESTNAVSPYCQQYQVLNDGSAGPIMDSHGNPIIQNLSETEPTSPRRNRRNAFKRWAADAEKRNNNVASNCFCEYMRN